MFVLYLIDFLSGVYNDVRLWIYYHDRFWRDY